MSDPTQHFYVLTGGPGAGKTTLLDHLAAEGFPVMPEAGRGIIKDQQAIGGGIGPWGAPEPYGEAQLIWEMRSHHAAQQLDGPVFFDRGVPDIVGFFRNEGRPVPAHVIKAAEVFRYHRRALIAPPWPEIYTQDTERKQDLAEAERTYHAVAEAHVDMGYDLVELPRANVAERAAFVRATFGLGPA